MQTATTPHTDRGHSGPRTSCRHRRAGDGMLRTLALVSGFTVAIGVVFFDAILTLFLGCPNGVADPSALCRNFGGVIDEVELCLMAAGALAALGGGIMSCLRLQARFLVWGIATATIVTAIIALLADQQVAVLS
jgi:hypothetical protein